MDPIPPETSRADALGRLRRERWFAADAGETARVEQIDAQIEQLSAAGTAVSPLRETAAAEPPKRQTAARTTPKPTAAKKATTTKGTRRVRSAR